MLLSEGESNQPTRDAGTLSLTPEKSHDTQRKTESLESGRLLYRFLLGAAEKSYVFVCARNA